MLLLLLFAVAIAIAVAVTIAVTIAVASRRGFYFFPVHCLVNCLAILVLRSITDPVSLSVQRSLLLVVPVLPVSARSSSPSSCFTSLLSLILSLLILSSLSGRSTVPAKVTR